MGDLADAREQSRVIQHWLTYRNAVLSELSRLADQSCRVSQRPYGNRSVIGGHAESNGCLASRDCTLGDLAVAAHLSAIDYFGEVPWAEFPAVAEWYMRMKSRPSFRTLLGDRVPGQPPVSHYADLDA